MIRVHYSLTLVPCHRYSHLWVKGDFNQAITVKVHVHVHEDVNKKVLYISYITGFLSFPDGLKNCEVDILMHFIL